VDADSTQTIQTKRLTLRAFAPEDTARLAALAGSRQISDTMISVPHPFTTAMAADAIHRYRTEHAAGTDVHFAVEESCTSEIVGYVAIRHIDREHLEGELSFWIDADSSGRGFATEAARAAVDYAFDVLGLNRICAYHMVRNDASRRVLERVGMQREGYLRQRVRKGGVFEDVLLWAVVRSARSGIG
jgi:RimJ/RimL family protein N-acetyltransferase